MMCVSNQAEPWFSISLVQPSITLSHRPSPGSTPITFSRHSNEAASIRPNGLSPVARSKSTVSNSFRAASILPRSVMCVCACVCVCVCVCVCIDSTGLTMRKHNLYILSSITYEFFILDSKEKALRRRALSQTMWKLDSHVFRPNSSHCLNKSDVQYSSISVFPQPDTMVGFVGCSI